jgi:hypothetical protein
MKKFGPQFDSIKFERYQKFLRKQWFIKRAQERAKQRKTWRKDLWLAPRKEDNLEPV